MRKPKNFIDNVIQTSDVKGYSVEIYRIYFNDTYVKKLIKWLEKVQKYNEFKKKKKVKYKVSDLEKMNSKRF